MVFVLAIGRCSLDSPRLPQQTSCRRAQHASDIAHATRCLIDVCWRTISATTPWCTRNRWPYSGGACEAFDDNCCQYRSQRRYCELPHAVVGSRPGWTGSSVRGQYDAARAIVCTVMLDYSFHRTDDVRRRPTTTQPAAVFVPPSPRYATAPRRPGPLSRVHLDVARRESRTRTGFVIRVAQGNVAALIHRHRQEPPRQR